MIVGIDLGTTNSVAAIFRDGAPVLIPNRLGSTLTPSAVSVDGEAVLVGLAARERQSSHPQHTATAFKRYMGTKRAFSLGGRSFMPEELSALVLRSLKEDAETFLGEPVSEAVITVPAYFNDKQRRATRRAGELAGLKVERLINEPTAAALAYGLHRLDAESRFLIFDLGGGTFDVSIVEIFEGIVEVRASTGDNRLGGEDFNEALMGLAKARLGPTGTDVLQAGKEAQEKLREQAERARRTLSQAEEATMRFVRDGRAHELSVTAGEFEEICAPLLARLRDPLLRSLRDGGVESASLNEIILVGGATRMPIVRKAVTRMFGRFPSAAVDPDLVVACGAAIQAGLKGRDAALKEVVLTDVSPFSLGIAIARRRDDGSYEPGVFSPILERNTVIPASRVQTYATLQANQSGIRIDMYQGEGRLVVDNVKIAEMQVAMKPGPAGEPFEVRFSYDINGLLEVDVHWLKTAARHQMVVSTEEEEGAIADFEGRRARLAALKVHPRDTEANRTALARAERCWSDALRDERVLIAASIDRFHIALNSQDPRQVEHARGELHAALDGVEGATFL